MASRDPSDDEEYEEYIESVLDEFTDLAIKRLSIAAELLSAASKLQLSAPLDPRAKREAAAIARQLSASADRAAKLTEEEADAELRRLGKDPETVVREFNERLPALVEEARRRREGR